MLETITYISFVEELEVQISYAPSFPIIIAPIYQFDIDRADSGLGSSEFQLLP